VKKALKGDLPLMAAGKALQAELMGAPALPPASESALDAMGRVVAAFKKTTLLVAGTAMQTLGDALQHEQEVLSLVADLAIETFAAESALVRATGAATTRDGALHETAAGVVVDDAASRVERAARTALAALAEGDVLRTHLAGLRRLLKVTPVNSVRLRRQLADAAVARAGYPFA